MVAKSPKLIAQFQVEQKIRFYYNNWRGESAIREAIVFGIFFGETKWHPKKQWIIEGFDVEKNAIRHFAMIDMEPVE